MEISEANSLVRDLDLTLQPRVIPRYKTWLPLATQQLRLRSLVQIIGHNLKTNINNEICWYYYTLHRTSMSSPLYTSETIDNPNPRWSSLEVPIIHATGYSTASEIILRLWKRTTVGKTTTDVTIFTWGISFTGLVYIGLKLPNNLDGTLKENSLIFQFHGGYFTPAYCFGNPPELKRYLCIKIDSVEVKESYTVNKLCNLRSKMQALKQQTESVQTLRLKIASGENVHTPKYQQSSFHRLFSPCKVNREKKLEILRIRKELEMAKFRTKLLEQERSRKMGELRVLNQLRANIMEENQDHGSDLMERYRELNKDIERLHEWRQNHLDIRESYIQLSSQLTYRRRQLISELSSIYPITQDSHGKFRINDVHLPDSEDLELANDTQVAVALGFVAHTTQMIANFLNVPTRYPIIHYGSRSKIIDHVTENLPDNERQFPLFARSKDKLQFRYAVYLLNKNIAQLRWYCGLPTADLRATLSNLSTLINIKLNQTHLDNSKRTFSTSSLDTEIGNGRHNTASVTPPIQKLIFEKCHRPSRSLSQLKNMKSSLGSSLDQGLDKPVLPLALGSQSKRICKSEESAIDNKTLALPKDRLANSSNETLNSVIISNVSNRNVERHTILSLCLPAPQEKNYCCQNVLIERNIEIMVPTSVSKSANIADSLQNSVSVRDRSSNSISSCEMALSSSQNDVDDTTNDKNTVKKEATGEFVPLLTDDGKNLRGAVNSIVKGRDLDISCNVANKNLHDYNTHIVTTTAPVPNPADQLSIIGFREHEKQCIGTSCLSLNDVTTSTFEESVTKQRINSLSINHKQSASMNECTPLPSQCDLPAKKADVKKHELCSNYSHSERDSDDGTMLETESLQSRQKSDYSHTGEAEQCDLEASSEYIDIIRRSSENVYARTEALVNKKTSFKVMKQRL